MSQETAPKPFFPPPLPKGGTVGLVSPSKWAKPERIEIFVQKLRARGYQVVVPDQNYKKFHQFAGMEAERIEALHQMFVDPSIDAIFCARGGTGAMGIIDRLDYDLIRENPKPFVGFSDITAYLCAINAQTGMVVYHGPMDWNFQPDSYDPRSEEDLFAVLGEGKPRRRLSFPDLRVARTGVAEGRLAGGNMCLLQYLTGTPYDLPDIKTILFLEEVEEPLYKIENMMAHFRLAGKFEKVQAVLVGEMVDLTDDSEKGETPYGRTLEEIMLAHLPPDIPVAFNAPCGHGRYISTFPVGADVKLELSEEGGVLSF